MAALAPLVLALVSSAYGQNTKIAQNTEAQRRKVAIAQMRVIATAMGRCPEEVESRTDVATYYFGPPTNVEWNVKNSSNVRAPFEGNVTFTLPERSVETENAKRSKKLHKEYMDVEIYRAAYGHEGYYQYDFDLGNGRPELVKVLFTDDKTKRSKPVPTGGRGSTCWERVARSGGDVQPQAK